MSRISPARISRLIGRWRGDDGKISQQLGAAIAQLIVAGELPLGRLLPSERALAQTLAISRGSVVAAYENLRETGMIDSRHGSGHRIVATALTSGAIHTRLVGEMPTDLPDIDMISGALPPSPVFINILAAMRGAELANMAVGHGYSAAGLPALRWAVARYYTDLGLPTKPNHILITSGGQQAISLLASAMVSAADPVIVEDPTYRGALEVFRRRHAKIIPITASAEGLDMKQLEKALKTRPKLLYLFVQAHNPTGRSFDEANRHCLVDLLNRYPTFFIEDGTQNELAVRQGDLPQPLAGALSQDHVATIGTLSKLFWGGIRIGWIRAAPYIIERLASFKAVSDLGCSMFDQHLALILFENMQEARRHRYQEIAHHLDVAAKLITKQQPKWLWQHPQGGTAIWIEMPGQDTVALCQRAQLHHLFLSAGSDYSAHENFGSFIRLPFVRPLETMAFTLKTIWQLTQNAIIPD